MTSPTYTDTSVPGLLTVPEAARALLVSRAGLAELVWLKHLRSVDGRLYAAEVAELATRRRAALSGPRGPRPFGQRGGVRHRVMKLLYEWDAASGPTDISRTLDIQKTSVSQRLKALHEEGYVEPGDEGWRLTDKGREYMRRSEPPLP